MFTRSEVIVLTSTPTNKQTPLKTFSALRYATTSGSYISKQHTVQCCRALTSKQSTVM